MIPNLILRARPYWTASTMLRRPEPGNRFTKSIALGYLRTAVDLPDDLLNWRAALALEQTGNGPRIVAGLGVAAEPPCDVEPEPAA